MFDTKDIALHLETAAAEKRLVTYSELADAFPPMSKTFVPWPAHPLSEIFEQLDQEDSRNNLPFRTAVVVNAKTKMPVLDFLECTSAYAASHLFSQNNISTGVARSEMYTTTTLRGSQASPLS